MTDQKMVIGEIIGLRNRVEEFSQNDLGEMVDVIRSGMSDGYSEEQILDGMEEKLSEMETDLSGHWSQLREVSGDGSKFFEPMMGSLSHEISHLRNRFDKMRQDETDATRALGHHQMMGLILADAGDANPSPGDDPRLEELSEFEIRAALGSLDIDWGIS